MPVPTMTNPVSSSSKTSKPSAEPAQTFSIAPLATFQPPSSSRTWQSCPHPTLPLLATACSDRTARIYSLVNFRQLANVSGGHKRSIRSVAWKPQTAGESVLATGSFDASAGIWRRWERESIPAHNEGDGEEDDGLGAGLKAEGADEDEDEEDGFRFSVVLDGHESEIKSLAWNVSGNLLATCGRDKSVWVWEELDDDNFETVAVLQEHEADVKCVSWHTSEDLLASASYDDTIRLYKEDVDDWTCIACLAGHESTVWWVGFEAADPQGLSKTPASKMSPRQQRLLRLREAAGPRLISASDDTTIRIWSRVPRPTAPTSASKTGIPSILRTHGIEEDWVEEARLPQIHERAIYSVSWSERTGMVVSAGSDGRMVVYQERWKHSPPSFSPQPAKRDRKRARDSDSDDASSEPTRAGKGRDDAPAAKNAEGTAGNPAQDGQSGIELAKQLTEWVIVAEIENAHEVYELNHVTWARRYDKGRRGEEEMIVSTGDDGEVRCWSLERV